MIELKNIAAKTIVPFNQYEIKELIKETSSTSVEDVLRLMQEYPNLNWSEVEKYYEVIKRKMALANKRGYSPNVYYTRGYDEDTLLKQDKLNKGSILLLDNPTDFRTRYHHLKELSIEQIKSDLSHTMPNGENYVLSVSSHYTNIGIGQIPRIISLIEMYEEQVQRQAKITERRDINLFELHKEEKLEIIEELYNEIILYLINNTEERLVWSKLTETQKELYLLSTISKKISHVETREKIKKYIANYTTLPEVENLEKEKFKTLQRFIIK